MIGRGFIPHPFNSSVALDALLYLLNLLNLLKRFTRRPAGAFCSPFSVLRSPGRRKPPLPMREVLRRQGGAVY